MHYHLGIKMCIHMPCKISIKEHNKHVIWKYFGATVVPSSVILDRDIIFFWTTFYEKMDTKLVPYISILLG